MSHEKIFSFEQASERSHIITREDISIEITDRPALEALLAEDDLYTRLYEANGTTLPEPCVQAHIQYKRFEEMDLPILEAGITFETPDSTQVGSAETWQPELLSRIRASLETEEAQTLSLDHQRSTFYAPLNDSLSVRISLEELEYSCAIAMKTVATESIDDSDYELTFLDQPSRYETVQRFITQWAVVLSSLRDFHHTHTVNARRADEPVHLQISPSQQHPVAKHSKPLHAAEQPTTLQYSRHLGFDDIGGARSAKEQLQRAASIFAHPELAAHYDIQPMTGFLLTGPAGTGKTSLARAFAGGIGAELREFSSTDIIGGPLGQSAKNIANIFEAAKTIEHPLVLLFDEFDSIAPKGTIGGAEREAVKNTLKQGLTALENHPNIIVAAATNKDVGEFDEALIRAGRLIPLYVPIPDKAERTEIWQIILAQSLIKTSSVPSLEKNSRSQQRKESVYGDDLHIEELVESTHGKTGADIKQILNNARMSAFMHALNTGERLSVSQEDILKHISRYQKP